MGKNESNIDEETVKVKKLKHIKSRNVCSYRTCTS